MGGYEQAADSTRIATAKAFCRAQIATAKAFCGSWVLGMGVLHRRQASRASRALATSYAPRTIVSRNRLLLPLLIPFCASISEAFSPSHAAVLLSVRRSSARRYYHIRAESVAHHRDTDVQQLIELGRRELQPNFDLPLDDWQLQAAGAIVEGHNVIVSAPTGAGKTVVGEMALHFAFERQKTGIYTTPLKALSNQKFTDLASIFGKSNTGLSTGDISINKGARITIMTTEVYRNIAWRSSSSTTSSLNIGANELTENAVVVLDEFHFMGHPGRGGVWEESIITSPSHTQIVGLSATLSNAPDLAAWMEDVTGRRTVLVEVPASKRPVPLRYLFAVKEGLFTLFRDADAGPGAPKGLLGFRGDGEPEVMTKLQKKIKKGFRRDGGVSDEAGGDQKIPRGLQVNPALRNAAARRLQKVDRAIERQKVRRRLGSMNFDDDEWSPRQKKYQPARKLTAREERKERERLLKNEMRRSVPSLHAILNRLDQKDLLPAIFFIFSRARCDEAARTVYRYMVGQRDPNRDEIGDFVDAVRPNATEKRKGRRKTRNRGGQKQNILQDSEGRSFRSDGGFVSDEVVSASLYEDSGELLSENFDESSPLAAVNWVYYSKAGLLSYDQVRAVASKIASFNEENDEIAFEDELCEQFLFGVGSHHAGMLPAHKSFVEVLFRNQLMKVVFATETLAAGINMPARTTVICAMAKRGDGSSMNLLETSNLLQMAGRAGRRGMDNDGTCVIVATPFESHDDAWRILTDPIKSISSQFSPSYSLCVNLIARGEGKLDVAKQLVSKSFATWQKRETEREVEDAIASQGENAGEFPQLTAQENFVSVVVDTFEGLVGTTRSTKFDVSRVQTVLDTIKTYSTLKKSSKSFLSAIKMFELEKTTLVYLQEQYTKIRETVLIEDDEEALDELLGEDEQELMNQIVSQKQRVELTEKEVRKHPFTAIATIINAILLDDEALEASQLAAALDQAREGMPNVSPGVLSPEEISIFVKSSVLAQRKRRKLAKANSARDPKSLLLTAEKVDAATDDSWEDFLSITRTLHAYGCLSTGTNEPFLEDTVLEKEIFELTPAGLNIGLLGFDNALWCLVAMGGAWDVVGASSKLDEYRDAMTAFESDGYWYDDITVADVPKSQEEASELCSLLQSMKPSELAGYVSSLLVENSRGGGSSVVETFQRLSPLQQRAIQKALLCLERLVEVQKTMSVDESTRNCNLDISNCEVVTAWTAGCSWEEAINLSGLAPGDLARTLSRVLDAVRQLGNLPFTPIRKENYDDSVAIAAVSPGLDPILRRLCREASRAINRYPVKDPLAFETTEDDEDSESDDDDNNNNEEAPEDEDATEEVDSVSK